MKYRFETKSKAEWLAKVTTDLKGKAISDLDWQVSERIKMSPLAHADDSESEFHSIVDRQHNKWYINEEIIVSDDVRAANESALLALEYGASSLSFTISSSCDFKQLFDKINLEWIFVHIEAPLDIIKQFIQYINESSLDAGKINCSFNISSYSDEEEIFNSLPLSKLFVCANSTQDSSPEEEIADLLVQSAQHLQNSKKTSGNAEQIYFRVNLTDRFYSNVAKIRALKLLWAHLLTSSKIPLTPAFIKAQMGTDTFSEDEDVTKIKASSQAIAAAIASVDIIHIPPSSLGDRVEFHRRISRNVSHLLQLESFMDRVIDPAAGSYYVEQLTDKIAKAAWTIFQQTHVHKP